MTPVHFQVSPRPRHTIPNPFRNAKLFTTTSRVNKHTFILRNLMYGNRGAAVDRPWALTDRQGQAGRNWSLKCEQPNLWHLPLTCTSSMHGIHAGANANMTHTHGHAHTHMDTHTHTHACTHTHTHHTHAHTHAYTHTHTHTHTPLPQ